MGGANIKGITLKAGMEQLDGNGSGKVFQTPLATLHAFNGWSDQFLSTPADGLRDIYASVSGKIMGVKYWGFIMGLMTTQAAQVTENNMIF